MKGTHLNRPNDLWLQDILKNEKSMWQKQNIIYFFFSFKVYMTNAASWNELKLLRERLGSFFGLSVCFCQGWRIRGKLNCFQVLSFLSVCFKKHFSFIQKSQEKHNTDLWRGMPKDAKHVIFCTLFSISPARQY